MYYPVHANNCTIYTHSIFLCCVASYSQQDLLYSPYKTLHSVLCDERPSPTTNNTFKRIFTKQCLQRLAVRLSMTRPGIHHRSIHVRFVVYKMALGQVFPRVRRLFPVSLIAPMFHAHLHLHVVHSKGPKQETIEKINALSENGIHRI